MIRKIFLAAMLMGPVAAQASTELRYGVYSHIQGNNTVHVWDMFHLGDYYGRYLEKVVIRVKSECPYYDSRSNAQLIQNSDRRSWTQDIPSWDSDLSFDVDGDNHIGHNLYDVRLDLNCDVYVEEVRVSLSDEYCPHGR